jgi:hypothetical protein
MDMDQIPSGDELKQLRGRVARDPESATYEEQEITLCAAAVDALQPLLQRGRDEGAFFDVFAARVGQEITAEDFAALYGEIWNGTFEPAMLERRKLLTLARQALAAKP